jgi:hypothetical protein
MAASRERSTQEFKDELCREVVSTRGIDELELGINSPTSTVDSRIEA